MSKSVYSLVLSDDIVRAVDNLAYRMGVSRSSLIDRILAEKLSVETPETRMRSIMENMMRLLDNDIFRLQTAAGDSGMLIRSPLPYKYKPTIRYSVELCREGNHLGKLKVSFRTQNEALSSAINDFYKCFLKTEAKYLSGIADVIAQIDGDRMERTLNMPITKNGREVTPDEIASSISEYVKFIDKLIKIYFEYLSDRNSALLLIDKLYKERMKETEIIL
ncbi:MAG: hypothetical protein J6D27_10155 [Ruminiclostridium sp.]|nr:hypothetical protein [Ruminiclostridium sp.]